MEWIPNQPVFFGEESECQCGELSFPQLSDNTDTIQFQFSIDNCGSPQMLENFNGYPYNDWVLSDGWSITDENLCHTGIGTTSSYVPMVNALFPYGYYQISIVVESFNGVGSIEVSIGNVIDGYDVIGEITGVGTWNFYAFVTQATNGSFQNLLNFQPTAENVEICFSSITGYKILTSAIVAVYNSSGDYISEISYEEDTSRFIYYQDTLTVTLQWSDLNVPASNGCYYLCFLNPCENSGGQNYQATILNPSFEGSAANWELEESSYFDEAVIVGNGNAGYILQENVFNAYINQCITTTITNVVGEIKVYFGTTLVRTVTSPGVYNICGVPAGNLSIQFVVSAGNSAEIEDVYPVTVSPENYTCNIQSNTFKLGNYTDNCTILVNACNNENGLGFTFGGSGFSPRLRIDAKIKGMKYPSERSINQDSQGTKKVVYFSGRKAKIFATDLQPEYIHDFLRLLFGFDNIYFDNVLYFVEDDEYNVVTNDAMDNVGSVQFLVSTRTHNVKNTNCSGTENDCSL